MNALAPRELTVRRASANDAQAIAALLADSFAEYQALYTPEGFAATVISSLQVAKRINERPVWVAISENVVVGTISVVRKEDSLYVRSLALHPAARARFPRSKSAHGDRKVRRRKRCPSIVSEYNAIP
jgi:N-acetylglutamate synthase-like GNAT family acetyltransferase